MSIGPMCERLYGTYASQHTSRADGEAAVLIYRRDIRLLLQASACSGAHIVTQNLTFAARKAR